MVWVFLATVVLPLLCILGGALVISQLPRPPIETTLREERPKPAPLPVAEHWDYVNFLRWPSWSYVTYLMAWDPAWVYRNCEYIDSWLMQQRLMLKAEKQKKLYQKQTPTAR